MLQIDSLSAKKSPNKKKLAVIQDKKPLIFLLGPTAAGKTQLAIEIVKRFPCEIISVDSVMVYRGMNIGAAKPTAAILKIAPHHLIDIADPADIYSAGRFRNDALNAIATIHSRGKIPLLVGGTMLYFRILEQGLADLPAANPTLRADLTARAQASFNGWKTVHQELTRIDPDAAKRIHEHDGHRIMRALEVFHLTGQTITARQLAATKPLADYQVHHIVLAQSVRANLHAEIAARFDQMLAQGLVAEVEALYQRGDLDSAFPSVRSAGYAQVWEYLSDHIDYVEMREQAIAATRQLAKRQMTWLKSAVYRHANWIASEDFAAEPSCLPQSVLTLLEQLVDQF